MSNSRFLGAAALCAVLLTISTAASAASFIVMYNHPTNASFYEFYYDETNMVIPSTSPTAYLGAIAGGYDGIEESNGTFYRLGINDEVFSASGVLGANNYITTLAGDWAGFTEYNGVFYGLGLNGEIFQNPGGFGGAPTLMGLLGSAGYLDIAFDGARFYGLYFDGRIFANPGNFFGTQIQVGYIGGIGVSGFTGLTYIPSSAVVTPPPPATVPLPAAAWLFGSGLLGLIGVARRRKAGT